MRLTPGVAAEMIEATRGKDRAVHGLEVRFRGQAPEDIEMALKRLGFYFAYNKDDDATIVSWGNTGCRSIRKNPAPVSWARRKSNPQNRT